jgi:hypothetical protein
MKPEKVKFTVEELQQIIQQEISWCKNNPTGVDDVYRKGFINGLLRELSKLYKSEIPE